MAPPAADQAGLTGPLVDLRIMATSDLHMHLLPFDYASGRPTRASGLAHTATLIHAARQEAVNAILLDNGDFLHGSAMGETIAQDHLSARRARSGPHPMITAMRLLGYDAITLGNHDFDRGVEFLGEVLRGAPFPVVASNLSVCGPANGPRPLPFTLPFSLLDQRVIDRDGRAHSIRVGLLGMLPPGSITGLLEGPYTAETRDIVATARIMVPQLRALGADLIVVLAHSGIGPAEFTPEMENAVVPLARLPGIDAIVAGHAHQVFPGPGPWAPPVIPADGTIHGLPVVAPGFWGSHLGVIDLTLARTRQGTWRIRAARSQARPVSRDETRPARTPPETKPDPRIVQMFAPLHTRMLDASDRPVGETRRRLHSYFATVAPSPSLDLIHRAMLWFGTTRQGEDLPDDLPLVASASPFKVGGLGGPEFFTDIAPGPISANALADLYQYPNTLRAIRLTGVDLLAWLERAASVFNTFAPGQPTKPLIAIQSPAYSFESVAGCDYEIDLSAPPRFDPVGRRLDPTASRVRDLRIAGTPVRDSDGILLLTHSFRVAGGGRYPLPRDQHRIIDLSVGVRSVIGDYLFAAGPYDAPPTANWRFAPVRGAQATVLSSPRACEVIDEMIGCALSPGQRTPAGFQEFHLAL